MVSPFVFHKARVLSAGIARRASVTLRVIHHREFAWLSPRGRTLFVGHSEDDAVDILDGPLIARIELHDPSKPSS